MADKRTQYVGLTELENGSEPIEGLLSPFEVDLNVLVKVNHELTLDSIGKREQEWIAETRGKCEERDVEEAIIRNHEVFCDDLRRAANNLAAVGLVTRFQHWVEKLNVAGNPKNVRKDRSRLFSQIEQLNETVGEEAPVPTEFFEDFVNARDSVIHGDSTATWPDSRNGQQREITEHHRNFICERADLEISEAQLNEAIENAIRQIGWYIEKLAEKKKFAQKNSQI